MEETKSYAFINRKGEKVTRETHEACTTGKAYGFFDCRAPREQIEAELPGIRDAVRTPSELELSLNENDGNIQGDSKLREIAEKARKAGVRYVMRADYPMATNGATANELVAVLNQAFNSPLYDEGEPFKGAVVYEENGNYVFKE